MTPIAGLLTAQLRYEVAHALERMTDHLHLVTDRPTRDVFDRCDKATQRTVEVTDDQLLSVHLTSGISALATRLAASNVDNELAEQVARRHMEVIRRQLQRDPAARVVMLDCLHAAIRGESLRSGWITAAPGGEQ